jgi:hypothetical protein
MHTTVWNSCCCVNLQIAFVSNNSNSRAPCLLRQLLFFNLMSLTEILAYFCVILLYKCTFLISSFLSVSEYNNCYIAHFQNMILNCWFITSVYFFDSNFIVVLLYFSLLPSKNVLQGFAGWSGYLLVTQDFKRSSYVYTNQQCT